MTETKRNRQPVPCALPPLRFIRSTRFTPLTPYTFLRFLPPRPLLGPATTRHRHRAGLELELPLDHVGEPLLLVPVPPNHYPVLHHALLPRLRGAQRERGPVVLSDQLPPATGV